MIKWKTVKNFSVFYVIKKIYFFVCIYKMVVEISKNKWESCAIKAINYYNVEKNVIELWLKMSHVGTETGLSNNDDAALRRIRKCCGNKTKSITKEEKEKYKALFEGEKSAFIIEKLACHITECCKLPKAIKLRKKLGYNHDDIMVCEETSIAEKIIKLFPNENIALNKKFNGR